MALSDDQKAMLRLLAQREQGYEDFASMMGIGVDEVRARVNEALAELESPSAPEPSKPPEPPKPPAAKRPDPPREPEPHRAMPAASPRAAPRPLPRLTLPEDRRVRIGAAAAAALVVFLVLLVAGVFGGGGDSSSESAGTGDNGGAASTTVANPNLTQAVLSPVDGGDASGRAVFGRVQRNAVLQVEAEGLEPTAPGQSYAVWLYRSPRVVLRVGAVKVRRSGGIAAQFPLPTELLAYVAGGAFNQIDISLTPNAAYAAEVAEARRERRLPTLTGQSVLRGEITGRLIEAGRAAGR